MTAVIFCLSLGYYRPGKVIKNGTLNGFGCSAEEWSQTSNPAKINSVDVLAGKAREGRRFGRAGTLLHRGGGLRYPGCQGKRPALRPTVGPFQPFKAKASHRHHIPRQRHRVRNGAKYDAGLRARGSLTIWFTPEAVERWRAATRTTPGGQRTYSDLALRPP